MINYRVICMTSGYIMYSICHINTLYMLMCASAHG